MDRTDKALLAVLLLALAAALFLAAGRARIERDNRVVEIIVDADDARRVASAAGLPVTSLLRQLREAGATALGVHEANLKDLLQTGRVMLRPAREGASLVTSSAYAAQTLAEDIAAKLPGIAPEVRGQTIFLASVTGDQLLEVPLELRAEDVRAAREAGLRVVARLGNYAQASPQAIEAAAEEAERAGAKLIVFRDDEVLGYQALLPKTVQAFQQHGLYYGYVEIAEQKGQEALSRALAAQLIRVHSITDADLEAMSPATGVMRYARAVRERGIRACYVRLLSRPLADPAQENVRYVSDVVKGLQEEGFTTGPPAPLSAPAGWPSQPARWLVALGVAAGLALFLRRLIPVSANLRGGLFLLASAALLALAVTKDPLFTALGGLLAASVFPSLGLALALQTPPDDRPVRRALLGLLLASCFSFAGGLLIVGLYSGLLYLQGIALFTGVKLAYLVPVLTALVVVIAELPGQEEPMAAWWERTRARTQGFFRSPVSWGGALLVVVVLGALAVALMRSGNESAVAPTGLELKMRNLLEVILLARPRTKEFLFGHPVLMLAIALACTRRRTWLPLIAVVGALGQISLLNTFCHLHIPLYLSLLRSFHGVWIGALFGALLVLVWRTFALRPAPVEAA